MSAPVHILATARKPELARFTELVFESLKVGFPTAQINVAINGERTIDNCPNLLGLIAKVDAAACKTDTIHHEWISKLIQSESEPFWILDTDVCFYKKVEDWTFAGPMAGYFVPEFKDEYAGAVTRSRLHTSLLYIDPAEVKFAVKLFREKGADGPFTPIPNLVFPLVTALNEDRFFNDTCSLLYHAVGGQKFSDEQKNSYCHVHFGTISDLVLHRFSDREKMESSRDDFLSNPELGRGKWKEQDQWYADRKKRFGIEIPSISSDDAQKAREWNLRLCKGNQEAMQWNNLWYDFVHCTDDLIDTMQDGRPKMSADQILGIFYQAAVLYNHPFYVKHRDLLFPTILATTNDYADSVAWEHSDIEHRRIMGDCLRTCGNNLYHMIAMICGGWSHVRTTSPAIRERDWLGQHDAVGNPT